MGLETGTYIGDLVVTNPTGTDPKGQGDDHLRLIKKTVRDSFAGFTGAVIVTGTDSGLADAYVLTPATALAGYVTGMTVVFVPLNANTGAATINISGLGAKQLRGPTGDVLLANEIDPDGFVSAIYDGAKFVMRAPTKEWIEQLAFASALPAQAGNAGKLLTTDNTAASWVSLSAYASTILDIAGGVDLMLFGDGSDGNATISAPLTLTRDMHYLTLTLAAGAAITPAGYRIFAQTLDLSNAPAGAIAWNGVAGNAAVSVVGGTAATRLMGGAVASVSGGVTNGAAGPGGTGAAGTAGTSTANGFSVGGLGGAGGSGGASANAGGSGGTATISPSVVPRRLDIDFAPLPTSEAATAVSKLYGGAAGASGGSGGDNGNTSGGGGGGAAGGGSILIFAKTIVRGASTAAAAIQAKGAAGGAGGTTATASSGGGGGGGGSGGGWVYIVYRTLQGTAVTGLIDVTGGNGGAGGNAGGGGAGPGLGAAGGSSGQGGRVQMFDVATGTTSMLSPTASVAGSANTGATGGAGGVAPTSRASL